MIGALSRLSRAFGLRKVGGRPITIRRARSRTAAKWSILSFAAAVGLIHVAAMAALDDVRPGIRDPEYGRRASRFQSRVRENPGRPTVMVIGSSRAAMGVRPAAWESSRPAIPGVPDPLIFNMSLLGSGPVMELMTARRVFADGLRPDVVLLEYWPPYLYSEGSWAEPDRVVPERLSPGDLAVVREYFPEADKAEAKARRFWRDPISANRHRLLVQFAPRWVPDKLRIDWTWDNVDGWGWKPGFDFEPGLTPERTALLERCRDVYKPLFAAYRIHPNADRALRDAIATVRNHGSMVGLVFLPESSEFRGWYPPRAERAAREHLAGLSGELGVPVVDARGWMPDGLFVDGFHLSRVGAADFTRRFGPAVAEAFPATGGKP